MTRAIIEAQAKMPNRLVQAEWQDEKGETIVRATINSSRFNTPNEIQELSNAVGGAALLRVQEILPF